MLIQFQQQTKEHQFHISTIYQLTSTFISLISALPTNFLGPSTYHRILSSFQHAPSKDQLIPATYKIVSLVSASLINKPAHSTFRSNCSIYRLQHSFRILRPYNHRLTQTIYRSANSSYIKARYFNIRTHQSHFNTLQLQIITFPFTDQPQFIQPNSKFSMLIPQICSQYPQTRAPIYKSAHSRNKISTRSICFSSKSSISICN